MTIEQEPGREYNGWPTSLVELASIIGREAALKISTFYGGRCVYVPKNAIPEHPLARLIGMDAFISLVGNRGGMELRDVPLASSLANKRRAIIALFRNRPDLSGRAIAATLRTTERYVRRVLNGRPAPGQRKLFED